ncbi:MAG: HAD family phosphatase [Lachnospiraceae bacterium]|nr:HAD family phosphatase [Lachnospiraceae bacterium]
MLTHKKAVIFDLDGTLVDSMGIWKELDVEYLSKFQIKLPENLQNEIEGMSFHETAAYFKNRFSLADSIEEITKCWNEMAAYKYTHEVPLKKGVLEFLELCKMQKIKIGIASSNSKELVMNVLKAHGIHTYFDAICTSCHGEKGKPSPDVYLKAAKQLQINPADCLVFEDIVPGIQAGKAAGMTVCAVDDVYSSYQKEDKIKLADYFIHNYFEIVA